MIYNSNCISYQKVKTIEPHSSYIYQDGNLKRKVSVCWWLLHAQSLDSAQCLDCEDHRGNHSKFPVGRIKMVSDLAALGSVTTVAGRQRDTLMRKNTATCSPQSSVAKPRVLAVFKSSLRLLVISCVRCWTEGVWVCWSPKFQQTKTEHSFYFFKDRFLAIKLMAFQWKQTKRKKYIYSWQWFFGSGQRVPREARWSLLGAPEPAGITSDCMNVHFPKKMIQCFHLTFTVAVISPSEI